MPTKWMVELDHEERESLSQLTRRGTPGARRMKRAQVLLMSDAGAGDEAIMEALHMGSSTVYRTRRKFVEGGLDHAVNDAPRPGGSRKLSASDEAMLVAIACSEPPEGRSRWTLRLLADRLVAQTDLEDVCSETIRRRLHEKELKPWQKSMWCIKEVTPAYIAQMEDVLDVYASEPDVRNPVVCYDETLKQLVEDLRDPLPPSPGRAERIDHHYKRNGIAQIALMFSPLGWRHANVRERRRCEEFAHDMRELVDVHFPDAEKIKVVLDHLSTHSPGALYKSFPPAEARRVLSKLEFHHTPKHASWLNMVEIEIGILAKQCLNRRIGTLEEVAAQVREWQDERNAECATINWLFTVHDARRKLRRHYPEIGANNSKSLC